MSMESLDTNLFPDQLKMIQKLNMPIFRIVQSINVYSFQQPHMIFQEKKAFTAAKLIISQSSKSVNMHRNDKLSCVGWCDKLGILSTTDVEMVP